MPLRVLIITSELGPLTGASAAADEAFALCRALARLDLEVVAVAPQYAGRDPTRQGLFRRLEPLAVPWGAGEFEMDLHEGRMSDAGARIFTIAPPPHLELAAPPDPSDPGVDPRPMAAFCRAAVELAAQRGLWPDVLQAGFATELAPLVAGATAEARGLPSPAVVFRLQALTGHAALHAQDLAIVGAAEHARRHGFEVRGDPHPRRLLEAAVRFSDRVVAPAPSLAAAAPVRELVGDPARLVGIANGADRPRARPTGAGTKLECQRELGLPPRPKTPLIVAVAPIDLGVLGEAGAALAEVDAQLVFLAGAAEADASVLRALAARPTRVAVRRLDDPGARAAAEARILAGADFALVTHRYPLRGPSPLAVLYSGALPIAPDGPGYADTLLEIDPASATGSAFLYREGSGVDLVAAVRRAARAYRQVTRLGALAERLRELDLTSDATATRYRELYRALARGARARPEAAAPPAADRRRAEPEAQPAQPTPAAW